MGRDGASDLVAGGSRSAWRLTEDPYAEGSAVAGRLQSAASLVSKDKTDALGVYMPVYMYLDSEAMLLLLLACLGARMEIVLSNNDDGLVGRRSWTIRAGLAG